MASKEITVKTCTTPTNPYNYNSLSNKPTINGVTLQGSLTTEDLNIEYENLPDKPVIGDGTLTLLNNNGEVVGKFSANSQENVAVNIGNTLEQAVEDVIVDGESVVSNGVAVIDLQDKQDKLVSGETIKTINGNSILGSGNFKLVNKQEFNEHNDDINARLDLKADEINLIQHVQDAGSHVLPVDRSRWNNKQDALISGENIKTINGQSILGSGNLSISGGGTGGASTFADLTGDPYENANLGQALNAKANNTDLANHINNTDVHVTELEKETWNNKLDEADLSGYATKQEVATKANSADVYLKTEVFNKAETTNEIHRVAYDRAEVDHLLDDLSAEKQDTLVSGGNIKTINGESLLGSGNINIESLAEVSFADIKGNATDNASLATALNEKLGQEELDEALLTKQDTLVSGTNIKTLNGQTLLGEGDIEISTEVTWGDITGDITNNVALQGALDAKANASDLTAHTGNAEIHVTGAQKTAWDAKLDAEDIADLATKEELTSGLATKQNTLSVGESGEITIVDNTISFVNQKGYQTDPQVRAIAQEILGNVTGIAIKKVDELPSPGEANIIYLLPDVSTEVMTRGVQPLAEPTADTYLQYIWDETSDPSWVIIGTTEVDLSQYATHEEVDDKIAEAVGKITSFEVAIPESGTLPQPGVKGTIYLIPSDTGDGFYDEYL